MEGHELSHFHLDSLVQFGVSPMDTRDPWGALPKLSVDLLLVLKGFFFDWS